MPRGNMPASRLDMPALIIKKDVGLELAQEGTLVQATQEHRLIHFDLPLHQGADGPLMRWRTACCNQRGTDTHRQTVTR